MILISTIFRFFSYSLNTMVTPRFAVRQRQARRDSFEMQCPVPKAGGCVQLFIPAPFPLEPLNCWVFHNAVSRRRGAT